MFGIGYTENSSLPMGNMHFNNEIHDAAILHGFQGSLYQGLIYSFGEEGMQLVQPLKFFSVTIFRTRSIDSIGMRACELGLCCYF